MKMKPIELTSSAPEVCKINYAMLSELRDTNQKIAGSAHHLSKLDILEDIKDHLMRAATGKDHLETKTAMTLFRILGWVIFGQMAVIVYLLTGGHVKIPFN